MTATREGIDRLPVVTSKSRRLGMAQRVPERSTRRPSATPQPGSAQPAVLEHVVPAASRPVPPEAVAPGAVAPGDFVAVFRGHPAGVALITADAGDGPVALTATSLSSVSADPPLVVFSVSAQVSAAPVLVRSQTVVVHFLDALNIGLARLGATSGVDRFADTAAWSRLPTGEPVYRDVRAWLRCEVVSRTVAAGSTIIVARALEAHIERELSAEDSGDALVYHNHRWYRLGDPVQIG